MTLKTTKLRDAIAFALAAGATTLAGTGVALAQQEEPSNTQLDRITVTGSRVPRAVEGETASPVLSIDRAQLEATGLTSVGDVLFNITASDGGALRNITTSTNGSDGTQNISLRGLGSTRTLVLVNGRRWITQGSGVVDLNTIPVAVVERIEVLKDGASAIYGSDAIAGVINVITRTNYEGAEARAYYGQYSKGDGQQEAYEFTIGTNSDRYNAVFSLSYTDQTPVFAGDRAISSVPVFNGGDLASGGAFGSGFNLTGNFAVCNGAPTTQPNGFLTCTAPPGSRTYNGGPGTSVNNYRAFISETLDGSGSSDRYNFAPVNYLLQPIERFNVYGSGTVRMTDNINFNAMATYINRRSNQQLAEVPLTLDIRGQNGPQWAFAPTAGNVFNPFGQDIRNFGFRSIFAGPRNPYYNDENIAVSTWLDGTFDIGNRAMYWDAGYSYLTNRATATGNGYINLFNLRRALGDSRRNPTTGALECLDAGGAVISGCVPFNLFNGVDLGLGAGVISQAEYDAMVRYVTYVQNSFQENETKDYFVNLAGDILDLPAGPLGFAVGAEHRRTSFVNNPDALVAGGGSSDNFSEPTSGSVNVDEYYAELNIPVLADVPFFKLLEFNLAARRSEYDASGLFGGTVRNPDIGSDTSKKLAVKWQLFDDLMLRGTYSESFRAPSVTDLFSGGGESFPQTADPCNNVRINTPAVDVARCLADGVPAGGYAQPNTQIRSLVGGNPDLRPEFGETRSFGVVYSPSWAEGLDFTLDWYQIKLTDVISFRGSNAILNACYLQPGQPGAAEDAAQREQFCSFVTRAAGSGNITDLRLTSFNLDAGQVEGYDFSVRYRLPETSYGRVGFQWENTYQTENDLFGTVGTYNGSPTWRLRSNLTTTWQRGDWDATWAVRYYSGLDEPCPFASDYYFEIGLTPGRLCNTTINNPDGSVNREENRLGASTYHDLQIGWQAPWNARIAIGGRNITSKEPPVAQNAFAHSFDGSYDLPGGGFYYLQYNQKF